MNLCILLLYFGYLFHLFFIFAHLCLLCIVCCHHLVYAVIAIAATAMAQIFTNTYQKSLDCNALQLLYLTSPIIAIGMITMCPFFDDISALSTFKYTTPCVIRICKYSRHDFVIGIVFLLITLFSFVSSTFC